jgi:hypothetical protein
VSDGLNQSGRSNGEKNASRPSQIGHKLPLR